MTTPLGAPEHPAGSRKDRQKEINALLDEFDSRTGRRPKDTEPQPLHNESKLSKKTRDALDALESKQKGSGGFYTEKPSQKLQQEAFDKLVKNPAVSGTGTYKLGPVSARERLLAWHRSLGSPQHVIDQELKALEQQEASR